MAVTIWDIAKHLELSVSTVSRALNGYGDVAPKTRQRVFDAARELGYYPSSTARNLRRGRTDKIGLLINTSITYMSQYLSEVFPGATIAAEKQGYNLVFYTAGVNRPDELMRVCRAREVDGVILLWAGEIENAIAFLQKEGLPFVLFDGRVDDPNVSYIAADNLAGALSLMRHLLELGHRRIGFTARPELGATSSDRLAGYRQALEEAGIPVDESLIISTVIEPRSGYYAANDLLNLAEPPTAIFAIHDTVAVDAFQAVTERGLRVPEDVAIAGFDGFLSSLTTQPPLTTVKLPLSEMGQLAVETLLAQASDPGRPPTRIKMPVRLLVRQSTVGELTGG
jgi:LacI family transcriptional regulator